MNDHYFTPSPQSEHQPGRFETEFRGQRLTFDTDSGVFSRSGLDKGTDILLNALPASLSGQVLDMGCGYGALGVSLAKGNPGINLTMADINERAVELAARNTQNNGVKARTLQSDGYAALTGQTFDWIVTNPPIRAGKTVIYRMFADGAKALNPGGTMALVIRKQQGAPSAREYLRTLFQTVEIADRSAGYWVLQCTNPIPAETKSSLTESDASR